MHPNDLEQPVLISTDCVQRSDISTFAPDLCGRSCSIAAHRVIRIDIRQWSIEQRASAYAFIAANVRATGFKPSDLQVKRVRKHTGTLHEGPTLRTRRSSPCPHLI